MIGANGLSNNALVAKLSRFAVLSDADIAILHALCVKQQRFGAGVNLLKEGDPPRSAFVITRGLAYRYRDLEDGRRQILTFLMPGDFFDLHAFLINVMDHSVATMTPTRLATIDRGAVAGIIARNPRIGAAYGGAACRKPR